MPRYNPSEEAGTVVDAINELTDENPHSLLWLHPDTQRHYAKLINVIQAKLEGSSISHNGIPRNPSYVVFTRGGYDYALYFDRERDDESQVMHLERYNTGQDYSNVWV